jgi:hypothetical protein
MMRCLLIALIAACSSSSGHVDPDGPAFGCPGGVSPDTTCETAQTGMVCFIENTFSSCSSGWYRCNGHGWDLQTPLNAVDGQSCAGTPLTNCYVEGQPDCSVGQTGQSCTCGGDGLWHCDCACYGAMTSCPLTCPSTFPGVGTNGPLCSGVGQTCTYPGHSCTCDASGRFTCS